MLRDGYETLEPEPQHSLFSFKSTMFVTTVVLCTLAVACGVVIVARSENVQTQSLESDHAPFAEYKNFHAYNPFESPIVPAPLPEGDNGLEKSRDYRTNDDPFRSPIVPGPLPEGDNGLEKTRDYRTNDDPFRSPIVPAPLPRGRQQYRENSRLPYK
eukprot:JP447898.1.p1 GENE.JP447898.1~~JP447898.1.p1  ORF type:complete len:157 (+),score=17.70 JP447898.1:28-498(+)